MAEQRITLESSSSDEASSEASAGSHTTTSSLSFGPPKIAVRGTLKSVQAANQTGSVQVSCFFHSQSKVRQTWISWSLTSIQTTLQLAQDNLRILDAKAFQVVVRQQVLCATQLIISAWSNAVLCLCVVTASVRSTLEVIDLQFKVRPLSNGPVQVSCFSIHKAKRIP